MISAARGVGALLRRGGRFVDAILGFCVRSTSREANVGIGKRSYVRTRGRHE
jgi:hypothetical protein